MKVLRVLFLCALIAAVIFVPFVNAQQHAGGQGLMYTHSARTLEKGSLNVFLHSRFFGQSTTFESNPLTIWDVQGSFALNYGLSNRVEFTFQPVVYQDAQQVKTITTPSSFAKLENICVVGPGIFSASCFTSPEACN